MIDRHSDNAEAIALYGTAQPVPERRQLTAGRLTAVWDQGALRTICWDGVEILRGIAFLSRDEAWGNNAAEIVDLDIAVETARFQVCFDIAITNGAQRLTAAARIDGDQDGRLSFAVSAAAETDFATNRTGLVILHPLEHVVGQPVDVVHTDGARARRRFPDRISPAQPIFDIRSLTHDAGPGIKAAIMLEGAKFEMEDHRNWMDASYKTYSGSLLDPWPYMIARGETVVQSATLAVTGRSGTRSIRTDDAPISVTLGKQVEWLPRFGTALSLTRPASALDSLGMLEEAAPAFLIARIDGRRNDQDRQTADLVKIAEATDVPLQLELILSAEASAQHELDGIADQLKRARVNPAAIVVTQAHDMVSYQPGDPRPPGPDYSEMAAAARAAFPDTPIGGGVVAFFTELNRLPVPMGLFDFVTHAVCPAVHAADDLSLMENLEAAKWIFGSTRHMIGATQYHLGPSWLSSRMNPYGPGVVPNPEDERVCLAQTDPRQRGLFGAAWLLGLAAAAAEAELAAVCLASLTGPQGLVCGTGDRRPSGHPAAQVVPAYHVLKGLAVRSSCRRLKTTSGDPTTIASLGVESDDGTELWMANLTARRQRVKIEGWRGPAKIHLIDETRFAASLQASLLTSSGIETKRAEDLTLGPYATARIASPAA